MKPNRSFLSNCLDQAPPAFQELVEYTNWYANVNIETMFIIVSRFRLAYQLVYSTYNSWKAGGA